MTMDEYFKMVEAASGVPAPWVPMPGWAAVLGARAINVTLGLFGKHDPTFDPVYVQMGQVFWYLDAARARQELGFAPRLPAETVRDTVQWLRAHMDELKTSAT